MSQGKDTAESCISIDESDANCSSLDSFKLQRNWMQLPQQLTQNLLAHRLLLGNSVLPVFPSPNSDMSHQGLSDTSVSEKMERKPGSCLPDFVQLGLDDTVSGSGSLFGKGAGEGRIETNTSEYYSAENGESGSGNSEEHEMVKESVTTRKSCSGSRSSPEEEIHTKRASLVKSKERYTSIEYDPSRRDSILVLAHGDSVFSEDIPPQPRRKCSRERLVKQRSQSTSDLPDLIQSSPSPPPKSPDVVPQFDAFRKRVRSEESLVKSYRDSDLEFINETFERSRKQEIEGTVHDGTTNSRCFKRSVSFQDSPTVYSISSQYKPCEDESDSDKTPLSPCSPHGEASRQHFRALKDSGYRTGSSSKGSLQSQLSDQTNGSDSVLTDNSVEKDDEDMETLTNTEPGAVGGMPHLSIFESESESLVSLTKKQSLGTSVTSKSLYVDGLGDSQNSGAGNVPCLSIFKSTTTSDGSLCLKSGEFPSSLDPANARVTEEFMPSDLSRGERDNSHVEVHEKLADKVLEERMEGKAAGISVIYSRSEDFEKKSLPRDKGLSQQPSRELFEFYITSKFPMDDPEALSDLLAQLNNLHFPSDSSTPSPSPHDSKQSRILASIIESFSPTEMKEENSSYAAHDREEVIVNDKLNLLKENLERTSRCQDNSCDDADCKRAKALLDGFNECVQSNSVLDKDQESVLVALRCHSERCEDIKCSVPYCALLCQIDPWDRCEALCQIRQKLDIILDLTDTELKNGRFLPLSPDCQHGGPMRENEQWMALSPLGNSRSVTLISDLTFSSPQLYVLKIVPLLEENHQWQVYEQLRGLKHLHLVQHMWIMEHGRDFLICTQFMSDGSLRHQLQESKSNLPWKMVVSYMHQIINGVTALHGMGIVYINWTSCNILLHDAGRVAKVSNLSLSVRLGQQNVDYGGIKNALPPAILPPELLASNPSVYLVSDSWGCGCLLYELLLGHKVWNQYRHETKDYIWKQLQGRVPPLPRELAQWPEVFGACWQYDYRQRHPLTNLAILLR